MGLEIYINKETEKETQKKKNYFVEKEGENVVEPTLYSICLSEKYQSVYKILSVRLLREIHLLVFLR